MSRGGGRGGKRTRPQIRAKGEDEDGQPLAITQPRPEDFQPPPTYPPLPSTPQPFAPSTPQHTSYLNTARLLSDHYTYSGYRLTHQHKESVQLQRYSDRYRRRPGQRTFIDECPLPSPFIFPLELQRFDRGASGGGGKGGLGGSGRGAGLGGERSKWMFMSAEALQSQLDRLTVMRDDTAHTASGAVGAPVKDEQKGSAAASAADEEDGADEGEGRKRRAGAADDDDDDEDEDEEDEQADASDDDDMGGGDYTDKYQEDDDGEGDDVFGDDGDGDVF